MDKKFSGETTFVFYIYNAIELSTCEKSYVFIFHVDM